MAQLNHDATPHLQRKIRLITFKASEAFLNTTDSDNLLDRCLRYSNLHAKPISVVPTQSILLSGFDINAVLLPA